MIKRKKIIGIKEIRIYEDGIPIHKIKDDDSKSIIKKTNKFFKKWI